jgi:hypothetical protein
LFLSKLAPHWLWFWQRIVNILSMTNAVRNTTIGTGMSTGATANFGGMGGNCFNYGFPPGGLEPELELVLALVRNILRWPIPLAVRSLVWVLLSGNFN